MNIYKVLCLAFAFIHSVFATAAAPENMRLDTVADYLTKTREQNSREGTFRPGEPPQGESKRSYKPTNITFLVDYSGSTEYRGGWGITDENATRHIFMAQLEALARVLQELAGSVDCSEEKPITVNFITFSNSCKRAHSLSIREPENFSEMAKNLPNFLPYPEFRSTHLKGAICETFSQHMMDSTLLCIITDGRASDEQEANVALRNYSNIIKENHGRLDVLIVGAGSLGTEGNAQKLRDQFEANQRNRTRDACERITGITGQGRTTLESREDDLESRENDEEMATKNVEVPSDGLIHLEYNSPSYSGRFRTGSKFKEIKTNKTFYQDSSFKAASPHRAAECNMNYLRNLAKLNSDNGFGQYAGAFRDYSDLMKIVRGCFEGAYNPHVMLINKGPDGSSFQTEADFRTTSKILDYMKKLDSVSNDDRLKVEFIDGAWFLVERQDDGSESRKHFIILQNSQETEKK